MKKILFISHDASRTGAPFVLLYLLQWFKQNHSEIKLTILLLNDGPLLHEFMNVVDECHELSKITDPKFNLVQRFKRRLYKKLGVIYSLPNAKIEFIEKLSKQDFDLIYANTVVSIPLGFKIKKLNNNTKLIVNVHELESEIKRTVGNLNQFSKYIDVVIAASGMVKDNLIQNFSVPANKIEVVYEFTKQLKPKIKNRGKRSVFTVGGSGKFGYRKGTDLFIQTARYLFDYYPHLKIVFTWVGLVPENERANLKIELKKINLNNRINFIGEVENPESYFNTFDVFLMTSREDPFPLVCIETGMLGIPIICFDKATGISEIIKDKGGFTVPYLNIEAMVEKIIFYFKNPHIFKEHSMFNQNEFSKFTVEEKGPKIYNLLERCISK